MQSRRRISSSVALRPTVPMNCGPPISHTFRRGAVSYTLPWFSTSLAVASSADHMREDLAIGALDMAIFRRKPLAAVHHSDQGSQYTSTAFEMSANDPTAYVTEATRLERSAHIIRFIASRLTASTKKY